MRWMIAPQVLCIALSAYQALPATRSRACFDSHPEQLA